MSWRKDKPGGRVALLGYRHSSFREAHAHRPAAECNRIFRFRSYESFRSDRREACEGRRGLASRRTRPEPSRSAPARLRLESPASRRQTRQKRAARSAARPSRNRACEANLAPVRSGGRPDGGVPQEQEARRRCRAQSGGAGTLCRRSRRARPRRRSRSPNRTGSAPRSWLPSTIVKCKRRPARPPGAERLEKAWRHRRARMGEIPQRHDMLRRDRLDQFGEAP